jgi:hypothetical protein
MLAIFAAPQHAGVVAGGRCRDALDKPVDRDLRMKTAASCRFQFRTITLAPAQMHHFAAQTNAACPK